MYKTAGAFLQRRSRTEHVERTRGVRKKIQLQPSAKTIANYLGAMSRRLATFNGEQLNPVELSTELNRRQLRTPKGLLWAPRTAAVLLRAIERAKKKKNFRKK